MRWNGGKDGEGNDLEIDTTSHTDWTCFCMLLPSDLKVGML